MTKIKGEQLMLFFGNKSIAYAKNHEINIDTETSNESTKDDSNGKWQSNEVTLLNWTATSENVFSLDGEGNLYDDLFQHMIACDVLDIVFAKKLQDTEDVPTGGWTPGEIQYEGKCIISDLNMNAPHDDYATFTCTFTGVGELTKTFIVNINNNVSQGESTMIYQDEGGPYDIRYYDRGIRTNQDVIQVNDVKELKNFGVKIGSILNLQNVYFQGGEYSNWFQPVKCRVEGFNEPDDEIYVRWLQTMARYTFVDTDLDIDGHDYDEVLLDGLSLTDDNYQNLPSGTLVSVKVDHNSTLCYGEVDENTGTALKINVWYFWDGDSYYPNLS